MRQAQEKNEETLKCLEQLERDHRKSKSKEGGRSSAEEKFDPYPNRPVSSKQRARISPDASSSQSQDDKYSQNKNIMFQRALKQTRPSFNAGQVAKEIGSNLDVPIGDSLQIQMERLKEENDELKTKIKALTKKASFDGQKSQNALATFSPLKDQEVATSLTDTKDPTAHKLNEVG